MIIFSDDELDYLHVEFLCGVIKSNFYFKLKFTIKFHYLYMLVFIGGKLH
jgi:hypothetical protein